MPNLLRVEWPFFLCLITTAGILASPVAVNALPFQGLVGLCLFLITLSAIFRVTHHADELAEMLGEPYGTLILTLSATILEVAIMITVLGHSESNPTFVRDTIAATVILTLPSAGVPRVCSGRSAVKPPRKAIAPSLQH